jgi:hypothetical protein
LNQIHTIKNTFIAALLLVFIGCTTSCNISDTASTNTEKESADGAISEPTLPLPKPAVNKDSLIGSWVRTDAPYNLNIAGFASDGTMKVAYLNPKPINVGKANWTISNGTISIYVELRDENYPGSHYTLFYMPERDLLAGKYFQAVEGVTYDVGFMRAK